MLLHHQAVGVGARFLKVGGPSRGERSCKLNRLVQISRELEPPLPSEESSPEEGEDAGGDKKTDDVKEDNVEAEEGELKIEVEDEREEKSERREAEKEDVKFEEDKEGDVEVLWGEAEKSRQKLHSPFVFPVIEVPAPPPDSERSGEEVKASSPSSKHGK